MNTAHRLGRSRSATWRPHQGRAMLVAVTVAVLGAATPASAGSRSYVNPVSKGAVATFPDPAIIRGKDGWWYAYTSTEPVLAHRGDTSFHYLATIRSRDQVNWEYVGDVFDEASRPRWHPEGSALWAPDVRYLDGRYVLYYSVAKPPPGPDDFFTVGVATSPTPTGPWTDSGGPVIPPKGSCDTFTDIDPAQFTAIGGERYLLWGSWRNLCVARLTADGTRVTGPVTEVYKGAVEGGYVVRRDGFYYLLASESNCCFGAFSGYLVRVGRSRDPRGPYVDRGGEPLTSSRGKGTFVTAMSGNRWAGPGHASVATDLSGQDWLVYHAIPRDAPFLDPPLQGINRRELLIDRLDWIDGWPTVRGGAWGSERPVAAPVTRFSVGSGFDDVGLAGWRAEGAARGGWRRRQEADGGGFASQRAPARRAAYLVTRQAAPARVEADLRITDDRGGVAALLARYRGPGDHVAVGIDAGRGALVAEAVVRGRTVARRSTPLPRAFPYRTWHNVAAELGRDAMTVELTTARQGDPIAELELALPRDHAGGAVGVAARGGRIDADNVGAAPLGESGTAVPPPTVGRTDRVYSDEFDDGRAPGEGDAWSWVRSPAGREEGGAFVWPTQGTELFREFNTASVLLRDAPEGDYAIETAVAFDGDRPSQQAGLVAYVDDDRYVKLVTVVNGGPPYDGFMWQTEFAKEIMPDPYGLMFVGTPAPTMRLRLAHRVDPTNGEHEFRAATSRDGRVWTWGGVWTLPAGTTPRIGLISLNAPGATARFDYFRTLR